MVFPNPGGGNFLEQLLGDLLKMMGTGAPGGGARVELARTFAHGVATGGEAEPNVDPVARMALEELVRLAELHVAELTGLPAAPAGRPLEVQAVGPGTWAWQTVEDWRFLLDDMAGEPAAPPPPPAPGEDGGTGELLARWMATMGPMMAAMQLGSAVGHLARRTFGLYELPVPRPSAGRLVLVPANIDAFAADWSLPPDQVRLWVCLRETTVASVFGQPAVADRIRQRLRAVVRGVAGDTSALAERLEHLDPTDPRALEELMGDPESLFGAEPSPERRRAGEELMAVTAALEGYVEHVLDRAAARLLGGRSALAEAWRRRQVDRSAADRSAEQLLGLDLGPAQVDRGVAFAEGVVERAGEEGLARLWEDPDRLPTPAEIDAPGLWLERISLDG